MRLTMREKRSVVKVVALRYKKASKKEKKVILNEFIELTGYNRSYASYLLRSHGKRIRISKDTQVVGDITKRTTRIKHKTYDERVSNVLKKLWFIMDFICGKRLAPILKELISALERHKEIKLDSGIRRKLLKISPATIDRLLAGERRKHNLKGRSNTKPGTLLKNQIPIRTFSEWDEKKPGFVEIDLVGHEGGDPRGDFIQTLDLTDILTGWTETQAVRNKAQVWVFDALKEIRGRLPFGLKGIDSDNGSEFINDHLFRFCKENRITFTRSRKYRKNDNCYVEQKNYSVVRRAVGYQRYDTEAELNMLNKLYGYLRLYTNYFQPVMKLTQKTRRGSKVTKRYDKPRTPYQRALESPHVSDKNKDDMRMPYVTLNPAELKRQITRLQNRLIDHAAIKKGLYRGIAMYRPAQEKRL